MASLRFDLPHPFGPTIAAKPPPLNRISVRSQKLLKPWISTRLSFSKANGFLPSTVERNQRAQSPSDRGS